MPSSMGRRSRDGQIFEIRTQRGLAYFQCIRKVPQWGTLIRVLEGVHSDRPSAFQALADGPEQFITYFPVDAAERRGLVASVGSGPLPPSIMKPMRFREAGMVSREGTVLQWFLVEGHE